MSFLWRLKPDFGYFVPSPELRRKLGTGLAFAAGGLVACASAVALIVPPLDAAPQSAAPKSAFMLAPAPSQLRPSTTPAVAAVLPAVDTAPAQKFVKGDSLRSCPRNAATEVSCDSAAAQKPSAVAAAPNLPAVADPPAAEHSVAAGDAPAAGAAEPAALVASAPALEDGAPKASDAAPPSAKPRKKVRRQRDRHYSSRDSSLWSYGYNRGSGYARQNSWSLFSR